MKENNFLDRLKILLALLIGLPALTVSCSSSNGPNSKSNDPVISSINPNKGTVGSTVTLNGRNFSSVKSENSVKFGTTDATVNSASASKLSVKVPEALRAGSSYKVTETVKGKAAAAPNEFTVSAPPATANKVPRDGVLETVTWNLEWFGYTSHGPSDEELQANNNIKIVDSLNADLFAFQEVKDKQTIRRLASRMEGYRAIFDKTDNQGNAFVYNTSAIDSLSAGKITMGQMSHPWAGRLPYYFSFNYKPGNGKTPVKIYAVVIHAKAGGGDDDYNRRTAAAEELYDYLTNQKPKANIILLGDFNDETTKSFVDDNPSPYKPFVDDSNHYKVVTFTLSRQNKTSETGFQTVVDNIIISNEVVKYYQKNSVRVFIPGNNFIPDYANTTSDHYPVEAKFDLRK